jgi:hypothetical protein
MEPPPAHLAVGTRMLPFDGKSLGWMHECAAATGAEMRRELGSHGYCLLRSALSKELVDAGAAALTEEVSRQGWLVEGTDPAELVVKQQPPGSGMLRDVEQDAMMNHEAIRRVLHGPELFGIFEALFGGEAVSFDYKWFRAVVPGQYSGFHMDSVYMGAGSTRVHTVWLPWHDVDTTKGGLVLLEGSNCLPGYAQMRATYGKQQHGQWFGLDPAELLAFEPERARWVTSNFFAGDIVIFPMLTMHGSLHNHTPDRLRFSADIRFQPKTDPLDPRHSAVRYSWWDRARHVSKHQGLDGALGLVSDSVRSSMAEAKQEWGLVRTPLDFPMLEAEVLATEYSSRNTSGGGSRL